MGGASALTRPMTFCFPIASPRPTPTLPHKGGGDFLIGNLMVATPSPTSSRRRLKHRNHGNEQTVKHGSFISPASPSPSSYPR